MVVDDDALDFPFNCFSRCYFSVRLNAVCAMHFASILCYLKLRFGFSFGEWIPIPIISLLLSIKYLILLLFSHKKQLFGELVCSLVNFIVCDERLLFDSLKILLVRFAFFLLLFENVCSVYMFFAEIISVVDSIIMIFFGSSWLAALSFS